MPEWSGTYQAPNPALQRWLEDFARWNAQKTGQPWDAQMPPVPQDAQWTQPSFTMSGVAPSVPTPPIVPPDPYQQAQELARRQKIIELMSGKSSTGTAQEQYKALQEKKPQ